MRSRRLGRVFLAAIVAASVLGMGGAAVPAAADEGSRITVDHDGDAVTVANGTSQVVRGTADFSEGTELVVRVRSTSSSPFLKSENAVVTENGTWAVAFDFSDRSAGESFSLSVRTENDSHSTSVEGEIVACGESCAEEPPRNTPTPRPEQTQTTTTQDRAPAVALDEAAVLVTQGDVATIELLLSGAETATLTIGDANETGHELVVRVTDGDGDGRATLFVDTSMAGRGGDTVSASDGDAVAVQSETALSSQLDTGDYPIDVYAGNGTSGQPSTVATLVVQSPDGGTATTGTGASASSASGGLFGGALGSLLVSGAFIVAGGGVALVLLRR